LIYNYSVLSSKGFLLGYQIEADSISEALSRAELLYGKGNVVRIVLAEYDNV
jgi:hypothetical protein